MRSVISIIIPTLNEENYLPHLLTDLKKQTKKNFEVIIVDGYSSDNTKKQAMNFKNDFLLHFIESPTRHPSFQRNLGAKKAKGSYLFFIDADTRVKPDAIEKADQHIKKERYALYLPVIAPSNPALKYKAVVKLVIILVTLLKKIGKPFSLGPIILIKRDLFNAIGGFNLQTTIAEDHNLVIKAHRFGYEAHFVSDVRCLFSMRRFEREGIIHLLWKYTLFSIETLLKDGVYKKSPNYEMGGHNYKSIPSQVK